LYFERDVAQGSELTSAMIQAKTIGVLTIDSDGIQFLLFEDIAPRVVGAKVLGAEVDVGATRWRLGKGLSG
jgi:hypothetical protein